jgi:hypothetical protein
MNQFDPEEEGSMFLRNIGVHLQEQAMSQSRRSQTESLQPGKRENVM